MNDKDLLIGRFKNNLIMRQTDRFNNIIFILPFVLNNPGKSSVITRHIESSYIYNF